MSCSTTCGVCSPQAKDGTGMLCEPMLLSMACETPCWWHPCLRLPRLRYHQVCQLVLVACFLFISHFLPLCSTCYRHCRFWATISALSHTPATCAKSALGGVHSCQPTLAVRPGFQWPLVSRHQERAGSCEWEHAGRLLCSLRPLCSVLDDTLY